MRIMDEIKNIKYKLYSEPRDSVEKYRLFYNENLFLPDEYYEKILEEAGIKSSDLRFYQDPYNKSASIFLSDFLDMDKKMILFANGVDHLIILISELISKLKRRMDILYPTFDIYEEQANVQGIPVRKFFLKEDYSLNPDILIEKSKNSFLIVCSPNNPTGKQFDKERMLYLIENYNGIIVLDETYGDFASYSLLDYIYEYDNLIVLRSFSKAYGLAGLRAGYAVSSENIINALRMFMDPYPTPLIVKKIVKSAISNYSYVKKAIDETKNIRKIVFKELGKIPTVIPYPSETNFIFFKTYLHKIVFRELAMRDIHIKDVSAKPLCENGLRVTLAPYNIISLFIKGLREIIGENIGRQETS